MQLRGYDVTGIGMDVALDYSMQSFGLDESSQVLHGPILVSDRNYVAEASYVTPSGAGLDITRSRHVQRSA